MILFSKFSTQRLLGPWHFALLVSKVNDVEITKSKESEVLYTYEPKKNFCFIRVSLPATQAQIKK